MATIEFSPQLASDYITRVAGKVAAPALSVGCSNGARTSLFSASNSSNWNGAVSSISIMKGTVPTDFTALTSYNSRSADVLATFSSTSSSFAPVINTTNPINITTPFSQATATGTATWFWLTVIGEPYAPSYSNVIQQQLFGTVGILGSGADLELANVNLTSGTAYSITNLRLRFPTSWTV